MPFEIPDDPDFFLGNKGGSRNGGGTASPSGFGPGGGAGAGGFGGIYGATPQAQLPMVNPLSKRIFASIPSAAMRTAFTPQSMSPTSFQSPQGSGNLGQLLAQLIGGHSMQGPFIRLPMGMPKGGGY